LTLHPSFHKNLGEELTSYLIGYKNKLKAGYSAWQWRRFPSTCVRQERARLPGLPRTNRFLSFLS